MTAYRPAYLVVTELFLPTKGGTAVWFDQVYRRMGDRNTHIVTAAVPGAAEHDAGHPNTIHRVALKRYRFLRPESLAMYARLFIRLLQLAVRCRFDSVHAGRVLPEGLVAWPVARLLRVPLIIYAHGEEITTWRQWAKLRAMRFTFRRAAIVIANSEFTRNELIKLGVDAKRIEMIHPGVDVERFKPASPSSELLRKIGMNAGQSLVLSVGRLSRRKGFDNVIRALPTVIAAGCDVHYALIGIGEDREHLERLARDESVAERVHFLGHVSMDELAPWYNSAQVFAMPNREIDGDNEGFGMVFLEAAACGLAVVAGAAGGTAGAVVHGSTGLRVDGTSLPAIAEALIRLTKDRDLARRLGAKGAERARAEFSWSAVADRTLAAVNRA
jgi:phosphatidylinositol alpha-1,6-mannosyltransferase